MITLQMGVVLIHDNDIRLPWKFSSKAVLEYNITEDVPRFLAKRKRGNIFVLVGVQAPTKIAAKLL